ncbi:MAG: helix-turn-helix transcriptional regulator [Polyangiaceae bacterium]
MSKAPSSEDVITILEAAYRVTLPEAEWMDGVLSACAPFLRHGMGTFGYLFDASGPMLKTGLMRSVPRAEPMEQAMRAMVENVPREYVERTWLHEPFGHASDIPGSTEILVAAGAPFRDVLAINGFDPSGHGIWVGTPLPATGKHDARSTVRWTRVAAHLGAAYRIRRRLEAPRDPSVGADAVAAPDGKLAHAEGDASTADARETLARAIVAVDRARTTSERASEESLSAWRAMVGARWSLVDHVDTDGRRYVVIRSNEVHVGDVADLSRRERQVLALLAIGHTTKVVAYELGITETTVRVLILKAMRKLGARSREELVARFRAATDPPR